MQRDDLTLVEDMLVEVRDALDFTRGADKERFVADRRTRKAVAHSLQTMGEAAAHVSHAFRDAHPLVPWAEVIGLRHRLVHGYHGVDYDIVWAIVREELPELEILLSDIVEE